MLKSVTLDVIKAGHGEFVGWGEQGGTSFMKKPSFMNYFSAYLPRPLNLALTILLLNILKTRTICSTDKFTIKVPSIHESHCMSLSLHFKLFFDSQKIIY